MVWDLKWIERELLYLYTNERLGLLWVKLIKGWEINVESTHVDGRQWT
jgi:hypothetical protein